MLKTPKTLNRTTCWASEIYQMKASKISIPFNHENQNQDVGWENLRWFLIRDPSTLATNSLYFQNQQHTCMHELVCTFMHKCVRAHACVRVCAWVPMCISVCVPAARLLSWLTLSCDSVLPLWAPEEELTAPLSCPEAECPPHPPCLHSAH